MKKTLLLPILCLGFYLTKAQQTLTAEAFRSYTTSCNTRLSAAAQSKDRRQLLELTAGWLNEYEKQKPATQNEFRGYLPGMYYNLACYQALEGQKVMAVTSFQKAVDAGYKKYAHAIKDSDLNTLRKEKGFIAAMEQMREKGDYGYILKNSGTYRPNAYPSSPSFSYQPSSAPELIAFRQRFNLDSICGNGDEISRIKNLLYWVHNLIRHDGGSDNPPSKNAIDLIDICQKENRGVNCRMLATILKDAYQAEGFASRMVTCMPKDTADFDCHVINIVWSKTLNKWLWMDPTNNAYVSDNKGTLLSIEEVRERLIKDEPLVLNDDANWNNKQKQTKEEYLGNYMSKNLYWLQCSTKSEWDLETIKDGNPVIEYVNLYSGEYSTIGNQPKKVGKTRIFYATSDPKYFWQKPTE